MRLIIFYFLILLSSFQYAQSEEAKNKILIVKKNLEKVPPYQCDIKINIDVSFIKIKEKNRKNDILESNEIDYKIKGFAFLPKKEMGGISADLFNSDFIAVSMGNENKNEIIKVILWI